MPIDRELRKRKWLLLLLALVCLVIREPESWFTPRFWAEDSLIFLKQSWELGWASLWAPQAGYLVILQRAIALIWAPLPAVWIPAAYNYSAWAVTLLVIWKIGNLRLPTIPCALLALTVAALPETGEVYGTLTNVQWLTAVVLVVLPLQEAPENKVQGWGDALWLAVIGLTGPYLILAWPLYLARLWRARQERWALILFGIATLCSCVQAATLLHVSANEPKATVTAQSLGKLLLIWPALTADRVYGGLFWGQSLIGALPLPLVSVLGVLLVLGTAWLVRLAWPRWSPQEKFFISGVLVALVFHLISPTFRFLGNADVLLPYGQGERYFVLARILLLWVLLTLLVTLRPRTPVIPLLGIVLLCGSWYVTWYNRYHFEEDGWRNLAPLLDHGASIEYRTNPPFIKMELKRQP